MQDEYYSFYSLYNFFASCMCFIYRFVTFAYLKFTVFGFFFCFVKIDVTSTTSTLIITTTNNNNSNNNLLMMVKY